MDPLALGPPSLAALVAQLGEAQTKDDLVDAVWDLRDSAYDHPDAWSLLTAETFFPCLADELEHAPSDGGAVVSVDVLSRAVEKARVTASG